jgi:hypothetical protein
MKRLKNVKSILFVAFAAAASQAQAAEIDLGDFSNPTIVGFGNPAAPGGYTVESEGLAISPVVFTTSNSSGLRWWGAGTGFQDCIGGCVTSHAFGLGTLVATLSTSFDRVGFFVGQADAFSLDVSFFDTANTLLGTVNATGPGDGVDFVGWQTDGLRIGRVEIANSTNGSFVVAAQSGYFENAVPEPATWAFMLLGFGLVGGSMRAARRKQRLRVTFA